jgi:hypothetical protein
MFNITQSQIGKTVGLRTNPSNVHVNAETGYEALGTSGGSCVIYSKPLNSIEYLKPSQLSDELSLSMYVGMDYILNQTGSATLSKYESKAIGLEIIQECQNKGPFLESKTRGRGFWLSDEGEVLVNSTQLTDLNGNLYNRRHGNYVYESSGSVDYYADTIESDEATGKAVFDMLTTFSFVNPEVAAHRVLGFIACAYLPGVLPWRPSVMLQGPSGLGKSSLSKNVHLLLGSNRSQRFTASDTSVAGVASSIGSNAIAMCLDEMEAGERTSKILSYNRNVSEGINGVKGSSSGKRVTHNGRTCFIFGGINPPKMEDADSNRLVFVKMSRSAKTRVDRHFLFADEFNVSKQQYLQQLGNGICARVVRRAKEMISTSYLIKESMLKLGYTDRICDTYAPVIAGSWITLNDEVMSEEKVLAYIANFQIDKATEATSLAQNLFSTVLNSAIRTEAETTTINYLIRDYVKAAIDKNDKYMAVKASFLSVYGIRIEASIERSDLQNSKLDIFVKNKHNDNLVQLAPRESREAIDFDGILMQQAGAEKLSKTVRIGGIATRAVRVPLNINDYVEFDEEEDKIGVIDKFLLSTAQKAHDSLELNFGI